MALCFNSSRDGVLGQAKVAAYCDLLCAESDEVTSEEAGELFDGRDGFRSGLGVAAAVPSSASFLRRFITVGRNLVDTERIPGSCRCALSCYFMLLVKKC